MDNKPKPVSKPKLPEIKPVTQWVAVVNGVRHQVTASSAEEAKKIIAGK